MVERRIPDIVDPQERIERATLAFVAELDAMDVIRRAAGLIGNGDHLGRRRVDEFCLGIDETRDQPWTRDAIDLRPLARDPLAGCRSDVAAGGKPGVTPGRDAACKRWRVKACGGES